MSGRILFIVQLPPPVHGVSRMNKMLIESERLSENFEIDVINFQFSKAVSGIAKVSIRKIATATGYALEIAKSVLFRKVDLIYFTIAPTGIAFYRDALYASILKIARTNIVYHLHGKGIAQAVSEVWWKKVLYKWVFKNTNVICLSDGLTRDIADIYEHKPIIVHNGIDEAPFDDNIVESDDPTRILFLSNIFASKGVLILLSALKELKSQGFIFEAELVGAAGDITFEELQNHLQQHQLSEQVRIVGPLYGADKRRAFERADLFVHPTCNDAFPLVILEAMRSGLPILSTLEGGIPDMVVDGETGFLVPKNNIEVLVDKIAILLKDGGLRRKMGRKGFERFVEKFTLKRFESRINHVFNSILQTENSV